MKTFEENWTAWIDGELSETERAEFEATLEDRLGAETERNDALKLGAFLKRELQPRAMGNEEFFHHQLRERIAHEEATPVEESRPILRETWWSIRRLLWLGATSLAIFAVCTYFVKREQPAPNQSEYLTQILNSRVDPSVNPDATVSIFQTKDDKVTVLWVDGLKSLPTDYAAK
ncbi:MAG: zf-HC2 domain-containing protein [Chthoniobacterales bacterium]|nr:zf-HC2 domain-containing protein [Chthoniobacterales bacterium]